MDALADSTIDVETLILKTDVGNLSVLPSGKYTNDGDRTDRGGIARA